MPPAEVTAVGGFVGVGHTRTDDDDRQACGDDDDGRPQAGRQIYL